MGYPKKVTKVKAKASKVQKKTKIKAIRASDKPKVAKRAAIKKERLDFRERKATIKKVAKTRITK